LTRAERLYARDTFNELRDLWLRYQGRCAWLMDNQEHPEWEPRNAATQRTGLGIGQLRDALAEWCAVGSVQIHDLLAAATGADSEPEEII
jgi:hypothetical protein